MRLQRIKPRKRSTKCYDNEGSWDRCRK